jgi:hypothetical protein
MYVYVFIRMYVSSFRNKKIVIGLLAIQLRSTFCKLSSVNVYIKFLSTSFLISECTHNMNHFYRDYDHAVQQAWANWDTLVKFDTGL